ncbi:MAG: VOC family protein [Acidimicrobiales bacterium]
MARVSTYLNFQGQAEEAFGFYASAFGTELSGTFHRFGDMPADPAAPPLSEAEREMVLHAELPILGGHVLMATDLLESMGQERRIGNNVTINLELDSREDADCLFAGLSHGATDAVGMQEMFWGAYWGTCLDRFGVRWMFNCPR